MFSMENLLRLPRDRSRSISFPLPAGALPEVTVTPTEAAEYRTTAATIIDRTVNMEHEFRSNSFEALSRGNWKLTNETEGLCVYKRMARSSESTNQKLQPMVLCVGSMKGTVEEVLYGLHDETTDQTRAVNAFVNKGHLDSAVLKVIDRGGKRDPFGLLALKWRLNGTPIGALVKNRDTLSLDSTGIKTDQNGEQFGYVMLKSVERSDFPPFSTNIAVRSAMAFCCIFRQVTPDTVSIYGKGILNLGGEMPDWLCYNYACPRMAGILKTTKCQKAKQLTALAIKNACEFSPTAATKLGLSRVHSSGRSKDRSSSADCTLSSTGRSRSNSGSLSFKLKRESGASYATDCALCRKPPSGVLWARSSLQTCQLCDRAVCSRCLVKKELLAVPSNIRVWCCKGCVLQARAMPIDTRALCPLIYQDSNGFA